MTEHRWQLRRPAYDPTTSIGQLHAVARQERVSRPMILRAASRLGEVVVQGDATAMPLAPSSVAHAVAVWVVHAVPDPVRMFSEARPVVRPGGSVIVCTAQRPAPGDEIGQVLQAMARRVDEACGAPRPRGVTLDEVVDWARRGGLEGTAHEHRREWRWTVADKLYAIEQRSAPAMRHLDDDTFEAVTRPAIEALGVLPAGDLVRRGVGEIVVLRHA